MFDPDQRTILSSEQEQARLAGDQTHGQETEPAEARRPFLVRFSAAVVGVFVGLVPLVSGGLVFLSPLRRKNKKAAEGKRIRVASLEAIPADGEPHRFPVIDIRVDKWNVYPPEPVGAVFLRRAPGDAKPSCYSAECPHLGCTVDFKPDAGQFRCPCHDSSWTVAAELIHPSASPRDLDPLEVEVEADGSVYVLFKKFRPGTEARHELT